MSGLNKMLVIGNLGSDPEMRYTSGGQPVTSFSLATNRAYTTRDGERREETEWFRIVAWSQLAETVNQYLAKGRRVYVEGRLKSSTWQGQDGQTRFRNEIIAEKVLFLDGTGDQQGGQSWQGGPPPSGGPDEGSYGQGSPNQGNPNQGNPNQGDPNQGDPNQGDPNQGDPNQGGPSEGGSNDDDDDLPW